MSNKIVPATYRSVIDDVINSMKAEFESYGVDESVLAELHNRWQNKVVTSNVAEFEPLPPVPVAGQPSSTHPLPMAYGAGVQIKHESGDGHNPYAAMGGPPPPGMVPYMIPGMPGQPLRGPLPPGARPGGPLPPYMLAAQQNVLVLPRAAPSPQNGRTAQPVGGNERLPQVDGPSRSPSGLPGASHPSLPPASHPSLPAPVPQQPPQPSPARSITTTVGRSEPASDAINSDLDDSDSDQDDSHDTEAVVKDIVFCTYDKVARVKNKWKCVLKDGMIHVNGKDYLFSKCTGEFEW